ncbi:MAG: hypothetical protein ACFCU2_02165 [Acidimicrobiia bacterium]
MKPSRIGLSREQTVAVAIITVLVSVGVVWLMVYVVMNCTSPTTTTATSALPPIEATTTETETTTTQSATATSSQPDPTSTVGVFDEVAAVGEFIDDFAGAIESGDSEFLFERLHPAVKATYEEEACREHIDERVLTLDGYRQEGPVAGPFDAEFGEFPITSYEALVNFEIDGDPMEETAVFSLTEGVVRWFAECS